MASGRYPTPIPTGEECMFRSLRTPVLLAFALLLALGCIIFVYEIGMRSNKPTDVLVDASLRGSLGTAVSTQP